MLQYKTLRDQMQQPNRKSQIGRQTSIPEVEQPAEVGRTLLEGALEWPSGKLKRPSWVSGRFGASNAGRA